MHKVAVGRADGVGPADEDVSRVDAAGVACRHVAVQVVQFHFEADGVLGEGEEEHVLERTRTLCGLFRGLPFLEERRERVAVDDVPRRLVAQQDAPVSGQVEAVQPHAPPRPSRLARKFVEVDGLPGTVARKREVDAQRARLKPAAERVFGRKRQGREAARQGADTAAQETRNLCHSGR